MSVHFLAIRFDKDGTIGTAFGSNCIRPPSYGEKAVYFCLEGPFMNEGKRVHAYVDYVLVAFPPDKDAQVMEWYCFTPQGMQCPFPGSRDFVDDIYPETMELSPFRLPKNQKKIVNKTVIWQR